MITNYILWVAKSSITLSLESEVDFICNKGLLNYALYFVYVVEACTILNIEV